MAPAEEPKALFPGQARPQLAQGSPTESVYENRIISLRHILVGKSHDPGSDDMQHYVLIKPGCLH